MKVSDQGNMLKWLGKKCVKERKKEGEGILRLELEINEVRIKSFIKYISEVEVANEKMRKFEREFQVEGVGIKFMKANKDGFITLQNVDEKGASVENARKVPLQQDSMHEVIPRFLIVT